MSLSFPTLEILAWIDANISLKDLCEFSYVSWPGINRISWPWPLSQVNDPPRIGRLHWPVGASRWATFHWIVTDTQLAAIRQLAYSTGVSGQYQALPLVLDDGNGHAVTATMFMLPARPLATGTPGQQLYLMTLVDRRYFYWEFSRVISVIAGTTTWAQMYSAICTSGLPSITTDAIDADYLVPAKDLESQYEFLPLLLDAVAMNVGQRVVVGLDGALTTQNPRTAIASQTAQEANWKRLAGGHFDYNPATNVTKANDIQALVPQSVTVRYPRTDTNGSLVATGYTVTTQLSGLALAEYGSYPGHTGTKYFHDEALAWFKGGSPANVTELNNLTKQIATDFYLWKINKLDIAYTGLVPWTPEGMGDIIWDCTQMGCKTRITPSAPFNNLNEEFNHYGADGVGGRIINQPIIFTQEIYFQQNINTTNIIIGGNTYVTITQYNKDLLIIFDELNLLFYLYNQLSSELILLGGSIPWEGYRDNSTKFKGSGTGGNKQWQMAGVHAGGSASLGSSNNEKVTYGGDDYWRMIAMPFISPVVASIGVMGVAAPDPTNAASGGAAVAATLGIYNADAGGQYPGTLWTKTPCPIAAPGPSRRADTPSYNSFPIAVTLLPNKLYWFAFCAANFVELMFFDNPTSLMADVIGYDDGLAPFGQFAGLAGPPFSPNPCIGLFSDIKNFDGGAVDIPNTFPNIDIKGKSNVTPGTGKLYGGGAGDQALAIGVQL